LVSEAIAPSAAVRGVAKLSRAILAGARDRGEPAVEPLRTTRARRSISRL